MRPLWYKAKQYGWGWYPFTWQGWFILIVALALILGYVFTVPVDPNAAATEIVLYLTPVWIVVAGLIVICWYTGEKPRWRWGGK
ncbi:MAG: hypothetical protein HOO67_08120 [Candidatus Peribacteraceae bacterium]|nr:hypothetical protein [Candidatus Peribacteraceae bacterium]